MLTTFIHLLINQYFPLTDIYHGINGNVSLDRRGELVTSPQHRYDLTLGSDKSSSLSRSEAGVYDISQAENRTKSQEDANQINNNSVMNGSGNINGTLESMDGEAKRRVSFTIIMRNRWI
jgi:FERM, RhoGEF and pleckstrin domain protein 2